jgi:hypothetical protein
MGFQPAPIGHVHRARCNIIDRGVGVRGGKRTQFLRKICRANPLFRGASERWCSGRPRRRPAACRLARCFLTRIQGCGTCVVRRLPLTGCGWGGKGRDPPKTLVKRIQAPVQEQTVAKKKKTGGLTNADGSMSSDGKSETDISRLAKRMPEVLGTCDP